MQENFMVSTGHDMSLDKFGVVCIVDMGFTACGLCHFRGGTKMKGNLRLLDK